MAEERPRGRRAATGGGERRGRRRTTNGNGLSHKRRLNRYQCDLIYGYLLLKARRPFFALVRPLGLMLLNSTPWGPWSRYRRREAAMGAAEWEAYCAQAYVIPQAERWLLPTNRTRDAIWCPDGVAGHV